MTNTLAYFARNVSEEEERFITFPKTVVITPLFPGLCNKTFLRPQVSWRVFQSLPPWSRAEVFDSDTSILKYETNNDLKKVYILD